MVLRFVVLRFVVLRFLVVFFFDGWARLSASNSIERSRLIESTLSSRGRDALVVPSVT